MPIGYLFSTVRLAFLSFQNFVYYYRSDNHIVSSLFWPDYHTKYRFPAQFFALLLIYLIFSDSILYFSCLKFLYKYCIVFYLAQLFFFCIYSIFRYPYILGVFSRDFSLFVLLLFSFFLKIISLVKESGPQGKALIKIVPSTLSL